MKRNMFEAEVANKRRGEDDDCEEVVEEKEETYVGERRLKEMAACLWECGRCFAVRASSVDDEVWPVMQEFVFGGDVPAIDEDTKAEYCRRLAAMVEAIDRPSDLPDVSAARAANLISIIVRVQPRFSNIRRGTFMSYLIHNKSMGISIIRELLSSDDAISTSMRSNEFYRSHIFPLDLEKKVKFVSEFTHVREWVAMFGSEIMRTRNFELTADNRLYQVTARLEASADDGLLKAFITNASLHFLDDKYQEDVFPIRNLIAFIDLCHRNVIGRELPSNYDNNGDGDDGDDDDDDDDIGRPPSYDDIYYNPPSAVTEALDTLLSRLREQHDHPNSRNSFKDMLSRILLEEDLVRLLGAAMGQKWVDLALCDWPAGTTWHHFTRAVHYCDSVLGYDAASHSPISKRLLLTACTLGSTDLLRIALGYVSCANEKIDVPSYVRGSELENVFKRHFPYDNITVLETNERYVANKKIMGLRQLFGVKDVKSGKFAVLNMLRAVCNCDLMNKQISITASMPNFMKIRGPLLRFILFCINSFASTHLGHSLPVEIRHMIMSLVVFAMRDERFFLRVTGVRFQELRGVVARSIYRW